MSIAYVDTSAVVAIAFAEEGSVALARRLDGFSRLVSSNLLEAELRAACLREGRPAPADLLACIEWVLTERPLSREIGMVLESGYLRGADLWHVATALYAAPEPSAISFITLDRNQAKIASALNFRG